MLSWPRGWLRFGHGGVHVAVTGQSRGRGDAVRGVRDAGAERVAAICTAADLPQPGLARALCPPGLLRNCSVFPCFSALKMTIKEVKKENGDKMIVPRKRKVLKLGPIRKKNLKKLVLFLKNGADCPCHQLDNLGHHFLIMGRQVKTQYLLTAIYKWDKKNKEFKKFMKKMKSPDCPTFPSVFK